MKKILQFATALTLAGAAFFATGCNKEKNTTADVMFIHASPGSPGADLYVQNQLAAGGITYGKQSVYTTVTKKEKDPFMPLIKASGSDMILGSLLNPSWNGGDKYTVIIAGAPESMAYGFLPDNFSTPITGRTQVRYINLTEGAPAVDVVLGKDLLAANKSYFGDNRANSATGFLDVVAGIYKVEVRKAGTQTVLFSANNVKLESGKVYTLYTTGIVNTPIGYALGLAKHN